MNKTHYHRECLRQLNDQKTYIKLTHNPTLDHNNSIQHDINTMLHLEIISTKTHKILSTLEPRTPHFYILPKIHKKGVPGRPILSANGCPTEKISGFIDTHLIKYVENISYYIKDTTHFLQILDQHSATLPKESILVTLDVSSLYTNIPPS